MKDRKISDVGLVDEFKAGDVSAFEEIISRYESKVMNLALRFTRNQEDAEEVMQDVFTTVYRKIDGFRGQSAFSSWLYRVTMNSSFMKIRARNRRRAVYLEEIEPSTTQNWVGNRTEMFDIDFMSSRHELREAIEVAIKELPEDYRAIFILRDIDGLSNEAVGKVLHLSVPAVKSRLHRSRLLMRQQLKKHYEGFVQGNESEDIEPRHIV
jgi:RNA polymerase sigma-70 factor (ECF subfamily)